MAVLQGIGDLNSFLVKAEPVYAAHQLSIRPPDRMQIALCDVHVPASDPDTVRMLHVFRHDDGL